MISTSPMSNAILFPIFFRKKKLLCIHTSPTLSWRREKTSSDAVIWVHDIDAINASISAWESSLPESVGADEGAAGGSLLTLAALNAAPPPSLR